MSDEPEKPLTLGLAHDRFLDAINNSPDDEPIDPEDAAEDLALQQEEIAAAQKHADENRALGLTDDEREDLWASFRDHQWIINVCNTVLAAILICPFHAALVAMSQRLAGPANCDQNSPPTAPSVGFISLGCPKNLVDSEVMMGLLDRAGARLTAHP
jgi:hypothetical protein